jgi:hypothetical protein
MLRATAVRREGEERPHMMCWPWPFVNGDAAQLKAAQKVLRDGRLRSKAYPIYAAHQYPPAGRRPPSFAGKRRRTELASAPLEARRRDVQTPV